MKINGYELVKFFYNELGTNPKIQKECNPTHIALYMWIVELQNRLGWEIHTYGLPSEQAMFHSVIANSKTYNKCVRNLVEWGLILEICPSVNASQSRRISLQTDKLHRYLQGKKEIKKGKVTPVKNTEAEPKQDLSTLPSNNQSTIESTAETDALLLPLYKTNKQEKPIKTIKQEETVKEVQPEKIVYVNDIDDLPF